MKNGKKDTEKRLAFLEKVYLEDRKRWKASEKMFAHLLGEIRELGERTDAILKIVRRKLEE